MHRYIFKRQHASLLPFFASLFLFLPFSLSRVSHESLALIAFRRSTISRARKRPVDQPFTSVGDFKFYLAHPVRVFLFLVLSAASNYYPRTRRIAISRRLFSIGLHRLSNHRSANTSCFSRQNCFRK